MKLTSYPLATIQPSPFWCSISKEVLFSVCGTSSCNDEGSLDSMYLLLNSGIILYKSLSFFVFSGSLLFWNNKKRKILNSWNTGLWNWPTGAPRGHYLITKPPSHHFFSQTFFICLQRHPPDPRRPKGSQSGREKRREEIFPVNFNRAFSPDPSDCPLGSEDSSTTACPQRSPLLVSREMILRPAFGAISAFCGDVWQLLYSSQRRRPRVNYHKGFRISVAFMPGVKTG